MIALTGSSGAIGGRVLAGLRAQGIEPIRTTARYHQTEELAEQLRGATSLLLVSGRESGNRVDEHLSAVRAAAAAGIQRVVYTSFSGASPDCTFTFGRDHWHTEQALLATGMRTVFLRDNLYQELLPLLAGEDHVIRGPAGDGRLAAVSQDDVAGCALRALLDDSWDNSSFELTGPEALTMEQVAAIISTATGRDVSYVAETVEEAYASRAHYGAPQFEVDGWVSSYTAIAAGDLERVSNDVERLLGRAPRSLAETLSLKG